MENSGPFIINEWLRLIEFYMVEYSRNYRGSQFNYYYYYFFFWVQNPIIQYAFGCEILEY